MRLSGGDSWMQRAPEKEVTFRAQIVRLEIDLFRCIGEPRFAVDVSFRNR
jgi:hypothetical protein